MFRRRREDQIGTKKNLKGLIAQVEGSGLFDAAFYRAQYPEVEAAGLDPVEHYLRYGAGEGRSPNRLFDSGYYLKTYKDVAAIGMNPLVHYSAYGWKENRRPHPLFDGAYYRRQYPDVERSGINPLSHYLKWGAAERRNPSAWFDAQYYLQRYPDVAATGMDPLDHYILHGEKEGRDPHPLFDGAYYLHRYPDVAKAGVRPLDHYLKSGAAEARSPNPWFNAEWYLERYPDVAGVADPLEHYILNGAAEGRDAGPTFDTNFYLESHPELIPARVNPLSHWLAMVGNGQARPRFWNRPMRPRRDLRPCRSDAKTAVAKLKKKPLISILLPSFNTPPSYLLAAVESVRAQTYPDWELCICDDGSADELTLDVLREIEGESDKRIIVKYRGENGGISRASNDALAMARGEFVAMLDHDDELLPDALLEVAEAIDADPEVDVLYTDQAYLSADGEEEEAIRKPDWSPRLFWGVMYVGHLLVARRALVNAIHGFDPRFDNTQDFELMLRLSERTDRIVHVPKVLYYWRRAFGSVARKGDSKDAIPQLQAMAVNEHLARMKVDAEAFAHPIFAHRLVIAPRNGEAGRNTVSIFIRPTGDAAALERCIDSVLTTTSGREFQAYFIGDAGKLPKRFSSRVKVLKANPFFDSPSGADEASADFWLSLSGDLEVLSADWLDQLIMAASLPGVSYVCPLVLQADGVVEEAGLIMGLNGSVGPAMCGARADSDGYAGSLTCLREVSAISDACVMARRQTAMLRAADEEAFQAGYYRMAHRSARLKASAGNCVCNPRVTLRRITLSLAPNARTIDSMLFANLWHHAIAAGDPFHNPGFSRSGSGYR